MPENIWEYVGSEAVSNKVPPGAATFIIQYFKDKAWTLEEDIPAQRSLRRKLQATVPDKETHVSAGSRIIDQGGKVTARHIAMLQAMKKALGDKRNLWHPYTLAGSALMALLLTLLCAAYFRINHPLVLASNRKLFLLVTVVVLTMGLHRAFPPFIQK